MSITLSSLVLLSISWSPPAVEDKDEVTPVAKPINFATVPRKLAKVPEFRSSEPKYGLFLFGLNGGIRIWAALDQQDPSKGAYDLLYFDRDGDQDLIDEEPIVGSVQANGSSRVEFKIGDFAVPGTKDVHRDFKITAQETRVSFKMKWRGDKITMGLYGPDADSYGNFSTDPDKAPVFIPGYDRPFTFEHWYSANLRRGQHNEFKVFVGNRGSSTGMFSCVDDDFLPKDEYPVATLVYHDESGKEKRYKVKLTERC